MFKFTRTQPMAYEPSIPAPEPDDNRLEGAQQATFAAECFWGIETALREIDGVVRTTVGYTGGNVADPTYEHVCSHRTTLKLSKCGSTRRR